MSTIVYKQFMGEIPNVDPHLLAPDRAQLASDCEFTGGSLIGMADGFLLRSMVNNPVKGIYTEDGVKFYTWNSRTYAFKSPVIEDANSRVYFLQPSVGVFNVTSTVGMAENGPSPSGGQTFQAGVPRPTVVPTLSVVESSVLAGYSGATMRLEAWWEYAGRVYEKVTVTPTSSAAFRWAEFASPAKTTESTAVGVTKAQFLVAVDQVYGSQASLKLTDAVMTDMRNRATGQVTTTIDATPDEATLAVLVTFLDASGSIIMSVTARESTPGRSMALPGGLEASLKKIAGGKYRMEIDWGTVETRAYVYTYTNAYGEEGAPSPASTISVNYMQDVSITVTAGTFSGYKPFAGYKVYRTFGASANYIQTDVTGTETALMDSTRSIRSVGSALESTNWTPPPTGLKGAVLMPNGWFAAFKDNMLYMSEPYRPHAWPYSMTFAKAIRGIAVSQQSMVVTTADGVYVVTGATPASAQQIKLNSPQAGISHDSMTAVGSAVAYLSNDGIVMVSGGDANMDLSQKLFTRTKWRETYGQALIDGGMTLAFHDGCLVATSKTMNKGFTIRLDEDVLSYSRVSVGYDAMFQLPVNDSLYYSIGSNVYQFKGGARLPADWWGRDWIMPAQITFGAGYLRASDSTTLTVYANGAQVWTGTVSPGHFRLPSLPRAERWSVRFTGSANVREFAMAQTMAELKSV